MGLKMEESWNKSIVCFESPIMAIPLSSVKPVSSRSQSKVPNGVIKKKRTPRVKVTEHEELGYDIQVLKKEEKKKKKKVEKKKKDEKKLRKPLPFDLNLMPDEYDYEEGEKVCKRKKSSDSGLQAGIKKIRRSKEDDPKPRFSVPNPAPGLPDNVREVIERGGELDGEPLMVLQRILNQTDLNFHHSRLAIPGKQVLSWSFLNNFETGKLLNAEGIETDVIMPSLEKGGITLKRWKMGMNEGIKAGILALTGGWNKVRSTEKMKSKEYRLLLETVLQVWAYRYRGLDNTVRFALVNLGWHPLNAAASAKITATVAAADADEAAR